MKKLILLLLFIPLISFSQDFRKMNFGESVETLTEKYPDIEFEVTDEDGLTIVAHVDIVSGINNTTIMYLFEDKKFVNGTYMFDYDSTKGGDDRLKDYKLVSEKLNSKYKMKNEDKWHKTTWKNNPNYHGFALGMGDVDFSESFVSENITIDNSLIYKDGVMLHIVNYSLPEFMKKTRAKIEDENEF